MPTPDPQQCGSAWRQRRGPSGSLWLRRTTSAHSFAKLLWDAKPGPQEIDVAIPDSVGG